MIHNITIAQRVMDTFIQNQMYLKFHASVRYRIGNQVNIQVWSPDLRQVKDQLKDDFS